MSFPTRTKFDNLSSQMENLNKEIDDVNNAIDSYSVSDSDKKDVISFSDMQNNETEILYEDIKELSDCDLLLIDLPEITLVQVMEYLDLKDRYYLSITCRLFYDLFSHPQLWQNAHIDLIPIGTSDKKDHSRWKLKYVMRLTMIEIVKRFSHVFHHLSLNMIGNIQRFDDVSGIVLEALKNASQLQSLTLRLGPVTSDHAYLRRIMSIRSDPRDFPLVLGLIHSVTRLKRLNIISWPLINELEDSNIMTAVQSNENLKKLESLSLFFIDIKKESWTERIPKLPSFEETLNTIAFLPNLTHLALRSPMIADETILLLASSNRCRLQLFQILLTFSNPSSFHDGIRIPDIASKSWKTLTRSSPHLQVELVVLTRVPWEQLQIFLRPEMPLSSFSLHTYSHCNNAIIDYIATHYKLSLKTFMSLCDSQNCDESLRRLVIECQHLKYLTYYGDISYKTVIELVDKTKQEKEKWDVFQFKEKSIKTNDSANEENEDEVVKYDTVNQVYVLGSINAWHEDSDTREKNLDKVREHILGNLHYLHSSFFV